MEDSFPGHHLPVFSREKEVAMAIEQVSEEEFPYQQLFNPSVSPRPEPDELNLLHKSASPFLLSYCHREAWGQALFSSTQKNSRGLLLNNVFPRGEATAAAIWG
jgi:hypothetical protein